MTLTDDLICPDCGGELGGTGADGVKPCTCFAAEEDRQKRGAASLAAGTTNGDGTNGDGAPAPGSDADRAARRLAAAVAAAGLRPVVTDDPDDESAYGSPDNLAAADPAAVPEKRCRSCGKDLRGHRRVRDAAGYQCVKCAKAEDDAAGGRAPCAECGRRVRRDSLVSFGTVRICRQCNVEHQDDPRRGLRRIDVRQFNGEEWRRIKVVAAILAVLLVIVLLSALGVIGS